MILYLGNKLSKHGYTPTSVETLGERIRSSGVVIVTKSSFHNKLLRLFDLLFSIFRYRSKSTLVIIDTYSTYGFWFAFLSGAFCRLLHVKYVPILRGGNLPDRLQRSPRLSHMLFDNSFVNIATSGYLSQEFGKRDYSVLTIHNYIDICEYSFKRRDSIRPRLLWVRSFHQIYNPMMALNVIQKLMKNYPDAGLCMVGPDKDGSMEICRKFAIEHGLPVSFTGRLTKKEWIKLSQEFDIFINTTNVDNTPVSVMESMALGMPVISTNVGGIPFLFENNKEGIMVDPDDSEAMTEAIVRLMENPNQALELAIAARDKANTWDWKNIGSLWNDLFIKAGAIEFVNKK